MKNSVELVLLHRYDDIKSLSSEQMTSEFPPVIFIPYLYLDTPEASNSTCLINPIVILPPEHKCLSVCVPGTVNCVIICYLEEDILESPSFLESLPSCHMPCPLSRFPFSPWPHICASALLDRFDSLTPNGAPFRPTLLSLTALAPLPKLSCKPY